MFTHPSIAKLNIILMSPNLTRGHKVYFSLRPVPAAPSSNSEKPGAQGYGAHVSRGSVHLQQLRTVKPLPRGKLL